MEDKEIHRLKRGGVAADTRESIQRDTTTLATATDTELEESDPFADVEEDKDELEENEFVHYTLHRHMHTRTMMAIHTLI